MKLPRALLQAAPDEVASKRREICSKCEFKRHVRLLNKDVCGVCGCPILSKTGLANAKCPKGKW